MGTSPFFYEFRLSFAYKLFLILREQCNFFPVVFSEGTLRTVGGTVGIT